MKPLKNITKFDSPAFQGVRVLRQKRGYICRIYISDKKEGKKSLQVAKEAREFLADVLDDAKSWRAGRLTRKAKAALTGRGFTVTDG